MATEHQEKFQQLLRQMFQFDCADLDFGIYRIMNFKRGAIQRFIQKDLIEAIGEGLASGTLAAQAQVTADLEEATRQIREAFGGAALDGDGVLAEAFHDTPLGNRYLGLQASAAGAQTGPALEASIFNHLYAFFSRYYDSGDFLSKRRYGRNERYAIPYNGEEVYLHWANHDQYYIKTGEYFTDYRFKAPNSVSVHFTLKQADVEQNNVKGDKRFFLPLAQEAQFDTEIREAVIPFEYRPLTEQEQLKYSQRNQQDSILAEAIINIVAALKPQTDALSAIAAVHHKTADGSDVLYLEHHLRQYTQRNTSDFFIHKDLKGFLTRELDFYLKNEVLSLDELEAGGESRAEGWFQIVRVIKAIGGRIIEFLAQIEDFQKMLFEKRKFITETHYCITVGNISEQFYADIAANEPQWQEWKELFHIDEEQTDLFTAGKSKKDRRVAFLIARPTLVLDTKHFDQNFRDRLLASFNDLDGMTDGLLVDSENFQALNLLLEKYREKVKCIYIDPPFNTENEQFLFKDSYRSSSWLCLMENRLQYAPQFLTRDGTIYVHVDHNSNYLVRNLLDSLFGEDHLLNEVIWRIGWVSGYKTAADRYVRNHETLFVYVRSSEYLFNKDKARIRYSSWDESSIKKPVAEIKKAWGLSDKDGLSVKIVLKDAADNVYKLGIVEKEGRYNVEDTWNSNEYEELHSNKIKRNAAEYTPNGSQITQKPEQLLKRVIEVSSREGDVVMDFFAGSGTTPAVAAKLGRKYLAVEMGGYFDTDMLFRMKQVLGGRIVGISRMVPYRGGGAFKYIRLESYEDALNNIEVNGQGGQAALKFDDYMLSYMLDWETRESPTRLNLKQLAAPFIYKLRITRQQETRDQVVDIPETFACLLGLKVKTRRVYDDNGRRYLVHRGQVDHREIVVIWRDTAEWEQKDYERDKTFVAEQKFAEGADKVFVNGDSLIPGTSSLDGVFKSRMFAPVGA